MRSTQLVLLWVTFSKLMSFLCEFNVYTYWVLSSSLDIHATRFWSQTMIRIFAISSLILMKKNWLSTSSKHFQVKCVSREVKMILHNNCFWKKNVCWVLVDWLDFYSSCSSVTLMVLRKLICPCNRKLMMYYYI